MPSARYYGPDSFTFTVSNGTNTSAAATVSITVTHNPSVPNVNFVVTDLTDNPTDTGSIRYIVNNVQPGDTVTFAPGLSGTITLSSTLTLSSSVTITGPGAGTIALSGNNANTVLDITSGTVSISGLTIENGYSGGNANGGNGGGVFIGPGAAAALTGCALTGNSAPGDLAFAGPFGGGSGGGVDCDGSTATLTNCTFTGNTANVGGGGIEIASGTATLTNCTFTGNSAQYGPGGLSNDGGTDTLTNDIFYGDSGTNGANNTGNGEIYNGGGTTAAYCDIGEALGPTGDGVTDGGHNINANPAFANAPGDLHLQTSPTPSHCIGAGTSSGAPSTDITGAKRPPTPSIGAYDVPAATPIGTPTANGQSVTTDENAVVKITLSGTDPDSHPPALTYAYTQPAHGTVMGTAPNVTYTPTAGYYGPDSFTFTVSNGTNTSGPATVNITVIGTPTATAQTVSIPFGTATPVTLSGTDPQGEALTYAVASQPAHGTLTGTAPGLTYTPSTGFHGTDSFTFTVKNTSGLTSSPATETLNVAAGTPTATGQSVATTEGTATLVTLSGTDPDSPALPLTYTIATQPTHGTLTGTAPNLTYTPTAGYYGPDSFTFSASNGTHTSPATTVSIAVDQVFVAPTANPQTVGVVFGKATSVTLSGADPQGEALTYTVTGNPAGGKLSGTAPNLTYTPNVGFHGADSLTFTAKDTSGLSSTPATVTLNVATGTPTATGQSVATAEGTAKAVTLSGTDPDSPALPLTYAYTEPAHGTVTGTAPNLTYTPTAGYSGADSFSFTVSNGTNTSAAATVSITVSQVATHLGVAPTGTATAGQPVTVTIKALDAGNSVVSGYSGTASLTDTDPRANPISPVTLTNGVGAASATFFTAGGQTVTATAGSLTGNGLITVSSNPNALPKIAVTGVTLAPGTGGTVTATVTLLDSGAGAATGVHLTLARLGGVSASSLGGSVSLGAGQSKTLTVTYPANAPTGAQTLLLSGADTAASNGSAGAFSAGQRVTVP